MILISNDLEKKINEKQLCSRREVHNEIKAICEKHCIIHSSCMDDIDYNLKQINKELWDKKNYINKIQKNLSEIGTQQEIEFTLGVDAVFTTLDNVNTYINKLKEENKELEQEVIKLKANEKPLYSRRQINDKIDELLNKYGLSNNVAVVGKLDTLDKYIEEIRDKIWSIYSNNISSSDVSVLGQLERIESMLDRLSDAGIKHETGVCFYG